MLNEDPTPTPQSEPVSRDAGPLRQAAPIGWRQTFSSLSGNRDFVNLFIVNIGCFFGMNMLIILRGLLVDDTWHNASY